MRCHACRRLSFSPVCQECREIHLRPKLESRTLSCGLEVLSFYAYSEIEPFLLTKHTPKGWAIYRVLAKEAFKALSCDKEAEERVVIPVDDASGGGYSHTALLARELECRGFRTLFNTLRARNGVSYSGRPLSFRLANPREFEYTGPRATELFLVDDIVTTGLTLQEAKRLLAEYQVAVEGAIVLADADR